MFVDYRSNFELLKTDLNNQPLIKICDKQWKELVNVSYEIPYDTDKIITLKNYETFDDFLERIYMMSTVDMSIDLFKNDIHSRRAAFSNTYPMDEHACKCIGMVQLFIRDVFVHINEFYRSQNFETNFEYDCQTAILLMKKATEKFNVLPGHITVFCTSLHKEVK